MPGRPECFRQQAVNRSKKFLGIDDGSVAFNDDVLKATGCPDTLDWEDEEKFPSGQYVDKDLHLEVAFTMTWTAAEPPLSTEKATDFNYELA